MATWQQQLAYAFRAEKPHAPSGNLQMCPGCAMRPAATCAACGARTTHVSQPYGDEAGHRHVFTFCDGCWAVVVAIRSEVAEAKGIARPHVKSGRKAYAWQDVVAKIQPHYRPGMAFTRLATLAHVSKEHARRYIVRLQHEQAVVHSPLPTEKLASSASSTAKKKSTNRELSAQSQKPLSSVARSSSRKETPVAPSVREGKGTIARPVRASGTAQKKRSPSLRQTERRAS